MKLFSRNFDDGSALPGELAFCVPDAVSHVRLGSNRNPHLGWSDVPQDARSLVLICHDPDVPSVGDDVNREGCQIRADLPRVDFFHWILVDLPPTMREIAEGEFSDGVIPRGKAGPQSTHGSRQGINDYTNWFAGDPAMSGDYFGYDGPCPPWNDQRPHRYVFTIHALAVERLAVEGRFTGPQARDAMAGKILASATISGRYSLNPAVAI